MDASEKIVQFETYEDLLNEVKQDMNSGDPLRCRYPVRFIMLNNFDVFTDFARDLAALEVSSLNLEDLLPDDDKDCWITTDDLSRAVKACTKNTLVTPFSELVRFYKESDFRGFFNEIMLTEDITHPRKRIYIPLIGLHNRFSNFLNSFARIEESAPVWEYLTEEQKTEVFLTNTKNEANFFAGKDNIVSLNSVYEWLRFWKNQAPQTQIICSSGPIYRRNKHSDPDNIFTFKYIKDSHEYIDNFLGVDIPFSYSVEEENFWEKLLQDILKSGPSVFNFHTFVSTRFNLHSIRPKDVFDKWTLPETKDYDRWLMKNYFLSGDATEKYPYLSVCFKELKGFQDMRELLTKVLERIFYFSESQWQRNYASERESLINNSVSVFKEFISSGTIDYIKGRIAEIAQNDHQLAIDLCTGSFEFEQVFLLAWYADRDRTGLNLEKAAEKYPALGMYLSEVQVTNRTADDWHLDYLRNYREAKIQDVYTPEIETVISERNGNADSFYGWYHSFEETHNSLVKFCSSSEYEIDRIYWIDALGAEFLPYILSLIEDSPTPGYTTVYSAITRCTIPSSTAHNKFENTEKYGELDVIAHENTGYKRNATLVRELRVLCEIIYEIICNNSYGEHTIAIVSDHGLSSLSRLCESKKYDTKVEHDGRYIKVSSEGALYHDTDYVVHTNENDGQRYKVALTHASLGRKPIHEVHGGCTPEEVLVPFIIISNKKNNLTLYTYELLTPEIQVSNPEITVNIAPQPSVVKLSICGKEYIMTRNGSKWTARIEAPEEGNYKVLFTIPGGKSFSATIQVIGTGVSTNDFLNF